MLNIIGAVLIIGATAVAGLSSVWRMGIRIRVLSELIAAIETMKSEICDRFTPIPALLEQLAHEAGPPVDQLFHRAAGGMETIGMQSVYSIWKTAVEDVSALELMKEERQTLIDLGRTLGRYDTEQQRGTFDYTLRRLEDYLRRAEAERAKHGRVHAVLGIAVGVFVVVILL